MLVSYICRPMCRAPCDPALAAEGVYFKHDERYVAADEFLTVWRRVLQASGQKRATRVSMLANASR